MEYTQGEEECSGGDGEGGRGGAAAPPPTRGERGSLTATVKEGRMGTRLALKRSDSTSFVLA